MGELMRRVFRPVIGGPGAFALLLLRLAVGTGFVMHGSGKIEAPFSWMPPEAPVPGILQALAALSEFFGGLALIAGLLTPLAAFGLLCTMSVAILFHVSRGDPFAGSAAGPGWELAGVYWCVALLMLLLGPGALSADAVLFGARRADDRAVPR